MLTDPILLARALRGYASLSSSLDSTEPIALHSAGDASSGFYSYIVYTERDILYLMAGTNIFRH